ncbi:hypothetical protein AZE42_11805, partial [Rhizopogon vesiculosus]
MSGKMTESIS